MYDAEIGFPGPIIDGTGFVGGGEELLSSSELHEDMVSGSQNAIETLIKLSTRPISQSSVDKQE